MKKALIVLVGLCSIVVVCTKAGAANCVWTTFEPNSAGLGTWDSTPDTGWGDGDDSDLGSGLSWIQNGDDSQVGLSSYGPYAGSSCGRINGSTSYKTSQLTFGDGSNNGVYIMTFFMKHSHGTAGTNIASTWMRDLSNNTAVQIDMVYYSDGSRKIRVKDSTGYVDLLSSFVNNTWYEFLVVVNITTKKFDIKVREAGNLSWDATQLNRGFTSNSAYSFDMIKCGQDASGDAGYWDNIRVVPEFMIVRRDAYTRLQSYVDITKNQKVSIEQYGNLNLNTYDFNLDVAVYVDQSAVQSSINSLKSKCDAAHAAGFKAIVMDYELNYPGTSLPDLYPDWTWQDKADHLEDKVYEIFTAVPELDGYMVTLSEGKSWARPILKSTTAWGISTSRSRIELYLNALERAIDRYQQTNGGKRKLLFFRAWIGPSGPEIQSSKYFEDPELNMPPDIIVDAKLLYRDVMDVNPALDALMRYRYRPLVVELDTCYSEYRGSGCIPVGMAGVWNSHFGDVPENCGFYIGGEPPTKPEVISDLSKPVNESTAPTLATPWRNLNFDTFFECMLYGTSPYTIYYNWAYDWYGSNAASVTAQILQKSEVAFAKGFNVFGINASRATMFWTLSYQEELVDDFTDSWVDIESKWQYTASGINSMLNEKDDALDQIDDMISLLQSNESDFDSTDYNAFERDLLTMKNWITAYRYYWECYFRYQYWKTCSGLDKEAQADLICTAACDGIEHFNNVSPKFLGWDRTELFYDVLAAVSRSCQ